MPAHQNRADSPELEEGLPTPLNNGGLHENVSSQRTVRPPSPPKRSAEHMNEGADVEMAEPTELQSMDGASGSKNSALNDHTLGGTSATDSVDSDPTSASAENSSTATSIDSSPFHTTAATDDRVLDDGSRIVPRPSYDEQVTQILQLMDTPLEEGHVGYLVANKWLRRVLARTSSPPDGVDKDALEGEVGLINNSSIMQSGELQLHVFVAVADFV